MKKGLHFLNIILCFVLITSCNNGSSGNTEEKQVENVGWILYNYDLGSFNIGSSAYIVFGLTLKNKEIKTRDIEYFKITGPNGYEWLFDSPRDIEERYSEEHAHISSGFIDYIHKKYYLLLGAYKFEIRLFNGDLIKETFVTPSPGSTETNKHVAAYTEEFLQYYVHQDNTVALPKRANIIDTVIHSDSIEVEFQVDDPVVFNGKIHFVNNNDELLATTKWFIDFDSRELLSFINNGEKLNVDGKVNSLNITKDDLNYISDNFSFDSIKKIRFELTDGKQYEDHVSFDCISITEKEI